MKKKITTAILTATAALAFANEPSVAKISEFSALDKVSRVEISAPKAGFTYFRMTVDDSIPTKAGNSVQIVPGLGIGYRLALGNGALDVSTTYSSGKGWNAENKSYFWMLPKASYLHYVNAASNQSLYGGVGLGWGALKTKDEREFAGIIPSATVGMEFFRKSAFRTFAELNVSQPAIAQSVSATFPGPIAEFSVGAGF
ncbi:MAG: hypothetical protein HY861_05300 [Chlamydiia bacterium]|nr:hypothetical protein [Chlamydiia bacterium]